MSFGRVGETPKTKESKTCFSGVCSIVTDKQCSNNVMELLFKFNLQVKY